MPAAARKGDSCTGHDACSSRQLMEGSPNVFFNGKPAARVASDSFETHGCVDHAPHSAVIASGSDSVFINGIPAARVGDPVSCGGTVKDGSGNIFIGG